MYCVLSSLNNILGQYVSKIRCPNINVRVKSTKSGARSGTGNAENIIRNKFLLRVARWRYGLFGAFEQANFGGIYEVICVTFNTSNQVLKWMVIV